MKKNEKENDIKMDFNKLVICPTCKAVNRGERYCHNCHRDLSIETPIEQVDENTNKSAKHNKEDYRGKLNYKKSGVTLLDIILLLISIGIIIVGIKLGIESCINSCIDNIHCVG